MAKFARVFAVAAVSAAVAPAAAMETRMAANPIRKVVNMLQMMQKKVEAEGEKAEELFEKFQCYCKNSGGDLAASIEAAETKVPELTSGIEENEGKLGQLKKDVAGNQADRDSAKQAMAEATAIRDKEKAVYDKALGESKVNHDALTKAVAALEKGMGAGFLQTSSAAAVTALVKSSKDLAEEDRDEVLAFLSGSQQQGSSYAPASGEIVGILKQMGDEMFKDQQDMIATEEAAVKDYESLLASKKKEVAALSKSIEEKLARTAEIGVELATLKNDLGDTAEALEQDKAFAANLKKNCASKASMHEEEKSMRAQEVVALADTIKVLNDDDALDLFKSTLPSASASFMQVQVSASFMLAQARAVVKEARRHASRSAAPHLDFIALALRGKKVGFEQVIKLVDNLVETLNKEQEDDDAKKDYCGKELDISDDKKKELERSIADSETVIEEAKEGISTLAEEIKALGAGIKALDKAVAEATEQRKNENAEYKDLMSSNTAAKELILFAKNRLAKFYTPKLYKAPPKRELSAEDRIYENNGGEVATEAPSGIAGTGISASFVQVASKARREAPPPPPETAAAYKKKGEESNGVMSMMDLLVKDLDKEMTVADTEEKNAQEEYEETMADSAQKRAEDSKLLTDKEAAKAELQASLEVSTGEKKSGTKELMATEKYIASLHADCDWLMQYYDERKQARADEVDSLGKAKAVLSGADYSFLQRSRTHRFLRGGSISA